MATTEKDKCDAGNTQHSAEVFQRGIPRDTRYFKECGEFSFQLLVNILGIENETYRRYAETVLVEPTMRGGMQ